MPEPLGSICTILCVIYLSAEEVHIFEYSELRSHSFVAKVKICKLKPFFFFSTLYLFKIISWHLYFLSLWLFVGRHKVKLRYKVTIVPFLDSSKGYMVTAAMKLKEAYSLEGKL